MRRKSKSWVVFHVMTDNHADGREANSGGLALGHVERDGAVACLSDGPAFAPATSGPWLSDTKRSVLYAFKRRWRPKISASLKAAAFTSSSNPAT